MRDNLLLHNGYIMPVDALPFKGDLLIKDGKIVALGQGLVYDDVSIIDAENNYILPGLVDAHSHIGLLRSGSREKDHNEVSHPINPHMRAIDAIDPLDIAFEEARSGGVTSCATGPGSINLMGGTFAAIKTRGKTVEEMLIRDAVAMKMALGENPKVSAKDNPNYPKTRMGVAAMIRSALVDAKNYQKELILSDDKENGFVSRDLALEALLPVLRRELPLKIHVHQHNDIMTAIRICEEFNLRYTLDHCTDGHLITEALVEALAGNCEGIIIGPFGTYKGKLEVNRHPNYQLPVLLYEAGIPFAIMTDFYETRPDSLVTHAALSNKAGLPEEISLLAITLTAATILGIEDRVGSLTPGKDADLAIFSAHPLRMDSQCIMTIIDGHIVFTR